MSQSRITAPPAVRRPTKISVAVPQQISVEAILSSIRKDGKPFLNATEIKTLVEKKLPDGKPLLSIDNKDSLYEAISILYKAPSFDEALSTLSGMNDQSSIIWKNPEMKPYDDRVNREIQILTTKDVGIKGIGNCGRCGSDNLTAAVAQTSGGDESMRTSIACIDCGHRWKE